MSNQQQENNLEVLINRISYELVAEKILAENEINKLLGVLASNGVYAMWVYALDKFGVKFSESKEKLREQKIFKFLEKIGEIDEKTLRMLDFEKTIEEIVNMTQNIKRLDDEINQLKNEIKKLEKNNTTKKNIKEKKDEKKEKENKKKEKEKERIKKLNEYFIKISEDIHNLLFLKQILEKVLTFARYHAKALGD